MVIGPPPLVDFTRRWDVLLDLLDEESGRDLPEPYEYPDTADESRCWPVPDLFVDALSFDRGFASVLGGQVVIADATWEFTDGTSSSVPTVKAFVGWLPEALLLDGRIPRMQDVVLYPLSTIGEGSMPVGIAAQDVLDGGVEAMRGYDDLLIRSAMAALIYPRGFGGVISTAATEVSAGAFACAETGRIEDLSFFEALARQEIRRSPEIRRSYVWLFASSEARAFPRVPGAPNLELLREACETLSNARTRWEAASVPLRSVVVADRAVEVANLDRHIHRLDETRYPRETFTEPTAVKARHKGVTR